ncbi:hypothetical protein [Streptomyces sp. LN704]|uniref:hypothetical protein n=1 Tax=unclassified Streptomyces TaxID=2593676 RepID=UPI0037146137
MDTRQHAPGAAAAAHVRQPVTVRLLGGPTAVIETEGLRLLTDPAFGPPGPAAGGTRTAAGPHCSVTAARRERRRVPSAQSSASY